MSSRIKILFVCGRNQKRSPTAAKIFQNDPRISVRSAGTSESSRRKISEADLQWADIVLVMESKYASRIKAQFAHIEKLPKLASLEIPDDYEFMDGELIDLIKSGVEDFLENFPL